MSTPPVPLKITYKPNAGKLRKFSWENNLEIEVRNNNFRTLSCTRHLQPPSDVYDNSPFCSSSSEHITCLSLVLCLLYGLALLIVSYSNLMWSPKTCMKMCE